MPEKEDNREERRIYYILIALGVVLIVLFVVFVAQYRALRRMQILNTHELHVSEILSHHAPLAPGDADTIRSWMTFNYVNKLFALPPNYLEMQLQINDAHYPQLTIAGYASAAHLDATTFLASVENAVRDYATSTPQNATSTE
jgi:hypothetical protein